MSTKIPVTLSLAPQRLSRTWQSQEVYFFPVIFYLIRVSLVFLLGSVGQPFQGAYLEISKNPKYKKLKDAVDEKIIIAEVVNKINRANGKVMKWHCFIQKHR